MTPANELLIQPHGTFPKLESPLPASPVAGYFQMAGDAFEQATRGKIVREFYCRVGGCSFCLRFADESLMPVIVPAIRHLEIKSEAQPDLTICIGDLAAAGVALEFPGEKSGGNEPEGTLWRHEDARFFMLAQNEGGTLSLADWKNKTAFYWIQDTQKLPWYERGFPLRHLFAAFSHRRDRQLIHAAAVGNEDGAVLIIGKGGSGKSTTSLACADAGLLFLGDDYTLVGMEPAPQVWSLYASAKATATTLRLFPGFKHCVHHDGRAEDKSLLLFNDEADIRLATSLPVRAVLWPRVTGKAGSQLRPASPATLLLALAPSTIFQMPGHAESSFGTLARLVQSVPTYILDAGSDMPALAETIKKLLSR